MHEGPNVTGSVRSLVDETLSAWEPMFSALDDTWQAWTRGVGATTGQLAGHPGHHKGHDHGHRHGCRECGDHRDHHDDCHECRGRCECNGCGADADVLITARPGERRVIPIEVRNPTHRDVTVTVDPGPWTSCDGNQVGVQSIVRPAAEVTIAGCSSHEFLLVVETGGVSQDPTTPGDVKDNYLQGAPLRCCATLTSDIRINGCGTTLRVAINVLPLDCDPVEVTCCGCCC
jgi:hypothetical protein